MLVQRKYLYAFFYFSIIAYFFSLAAVDLHVTTNVDDPTLVNTGTLRYQILQANSNLGVSYNILFDAGSAGTTTLLNSLPLISPNILSIQSNGQSITIDGGNLYQIFALQPGASVNIGNDIQIMRGASIGGNGGSGINGGGGALGAGGGIFIPNGASAVIHGVTFVNCLAKGGNGGVSDQSGLTNAGGGGGGMCRGHGGSAPGFDGGGGGGGYGGPGGAGGGLSGGGGGGLLFSGGNGVEFAGGGGGSNAHPGQAGSSGGQGGNGGTDFAGNPGGTGGNIGMNGGNGIENSGGGGGGAGNTSGGNGGNGGNALLGAGGGGGVEQNGLGGNGGNSTGFGGGGGGGLGENVIGGGGSSGGGGGTFGGGGGGSFTDQLNSTPFSAPGGNGGFGGGGGGAGQADAIPLLTSGVGNGGFGAGGGGGYNSSHSGLGGFGGGKGGGRTEGGAAGGGGAALGGTIFIGAGGSLTIQDPFQSSLNSTIAAGTGANSGQALGQDIFIMSSGTLHFQQSTTFTINTSIASDNGAGGGSTSTGGLVMSGTGTLVLGGNNTYTGSTRIQGGIVQISSDQNLGAPANSLLIGPGTLQVTSNMVSSRPITLTGSGGIQTDADFSVFGSIGGGSLIKSGAGTLTLFNLNTYTGTTTISSGTLQIAADNVLPSGNVLNSGILLFSHPGDAVYTGSISGGGMLKVESVNFGSLRLTGVNTYMGVTLVEQGTLFVNGALTASSTTVNPLGTLGGTGQVQEVIVHGTLAPGNSVGTLQATDVTFNNGSTFEVAINNTNASLLIATNSVTIHPTANLTLNPEGFVVLPQLTTYAIVTSPMITVNAPFRLIPFSPRHVLFDALYTPTEILLLLQVLAYSDLLPPGDEKKTAECFEVLITENIAPDLIDIIEILDTKTPSELQHTFHQMQPSAFDNIAYAQQNVSERMRQIFTRHFYEQRVVSCPEEGRRLRVWLTPFAEKVRQYGHGLFYGYKERFAGVIAAGDYCLRRWMFSTGFTYAASQVRIPHGRARGHFRTYAGTLTTGWTNTKWFFDTMLSYLYRPIDAYRRMHFSAPSIGLEENRKASHRMGSNQGLAHFGGGYNYLIVAGSKDVVKIYPFFNLDYLYSYQSSYRERGAGSLNLKVYGKPYDLFRPEAGAGIGYHGCFKKITVMADLSATYAVEFRYLGKLTSTRFIESSCKFSVSGLNPENTLICPTARLRLATPYGFSLTLGYHGEFGDDFRENAVETELRKAF